MLSAAPTTGISLSITTSKQEKVKYVAYECIKSELKEEYTRKVQSVTKKFKVDHEKDAGF